jgi:hypothetical protein
MKSILGLAAAFIDRMENPAHGLAENEAYSARFAELVARDENLYKLLTAEDLGPHDVDLLSTTAWLWFLRWLKDEAIPMPGTSFLDSLYDHVGDPVAKLGIVDVVVSAPYLVESFRRLEERNVYLEDLPGFWLRDRLLGIVHGRDERETLDEESPTRLVQAIEITTFLLQAGNVVALTTLRSVLTYPWQYQTELRQIVDERLRINTESEQDREEWRRRLGLNERRERR